MHAMTVGGALDGFGKLLVFLVMLSILVVLHEFGHFWVARRNGVRVNDFAVGFGPTLFKWTSPRTGTNYRINAIPLGGYCAMHGEDGRTNEAEQRRRFLAAQDGGAAAQAEPADDDLQGNFQNKTAAQRLAIVVAGPAANFLLAFLLLVSAALLFGVPSDQTSTIIGPPLKAGYPAEKAGLQVGDRIVALNDKPIATGKEMIETIRASLGRDLKITFDRHGEIQSVTVRPVPALLGSKKIGVIGFVPTSTYQRVGPIEAVHQAIGGFDRLALTTFKSFGMLITNPAQAGSSLSGPVGIARSAAAIQDLGWGPYLWLAAVLSLNLGIFNLLPLPALDGGRAVFILAEMLRGKPVDPEKEAFVHVAGFAFLMVVIALVTYHDITNFISGKGALQ